MKRMITSTAFTLLLLLAMPAIAATPLDAVVALDGFTTSSTAQVRFLNASPDVGPVDFYIAQYREAENVAFEELTDAKQIATASFVVRVLPAGETDTPLVETGISFQQGHERTLVLTGMADDLELQDVESSGPGTSPSDSYVRFVHTSPDAGAMDLALAGGEVLLAGVEFREESEFSTLSGGTYDFEIRAADGTVMVQIPRLWLQDARFYTVYLTGLETDEGPDQGSTFFVPAAARDAGSEGSFWMTDLDILNTDVTGVSYQFMWLPRGEDNSDPLMSEMFTLEAAHTMRHADVLGSVFGFDDATPATGALAVMVDSAHVSVFSRTYNQTDVGTYGQAMPGLSAGDLIPAGTVKHVMFMTENGEFRSNLGIMNGTSSPITVRYRSILMDGSVWASRSVDLPPYGNTQINRIFEDAAPMEAGYVEIWSETHNGAFAVYGSVLDNPTSDPTTVMP